MATRWVKIKDMVRKLSIERRIHNWYHDTMKSMWRKVEKVCNSIARTSWSKAFGHQVNHIDTDEERRKRREAFENLEAMISGKYAAEWAAAKREQTK